MTSISLKDRCAIAGIGETEYVRGTDKSVLRLQLEAAIKAIADAGLNPKDIDGIIPYPGSGIISEQLQVNLGIPELRFGSTIHQGGAGPVASVETAVMAVITGAANHVLMVAGRAGYSKSPISARVTGGRPEFDLMDEFEKPYGSLVPCHWYAAAARRHMHEYGTTSRQLGHVAVAFRKHANLNPRAIMHGKPMTIEDHQNSRMLADPFRLFDCSLETDGAAAVVITTVQRAQDLRKKPAMIMGVAQGHPDWPTSITQKPVITEIGGIRRAARKCFAMAGITPKDVDVAEIYDCFTWVALCSLEDIGFCEKGEGGAFVEGGRIELGGVLPVNTHGGELSEAHVSGMNHIVEAVRQIRGEADAHQSAKAEIVLVSGYGNLFEGSVMLLRR